MTVDGRALAATLKDKIKEETVGKDFSLAVFVVGNDPASETFVKMKQKFGETVGIKVNVETLPADISTDELVSNIKASKGSYQGIVVQLPLPAHIGADAARNAIPVTHDVDVLSDEACEQFKKGNLPILPPVAGAIAEIVKCHDVAIKSKKVVVVGQGRLVGAPAAIWFKQQGADVDTTDKEAFDISNETKKADIVVLGAGVPGLLKHDMVKNDVVIFDAGTSEAKGKLVGDADPACAEKASLFTPVPGGVGPITVAVLFKNLFTLAR